MALLPSSFAAADEVSDGQGVVRVVFGSMPPKFTSDDAEQDTCDAQPKYQMFQTSTPLEFDAQAVLRAQAVKSQCGNDEEHEKNWIPFADGDTLRYVRMVRNHMLPTLTLTPIPTPTLTLTEPEPEREPEPEPEPEPGERPHCRCPGRAGAVPARGG